jgi:hypothetical protein
MCQAPRVSNRPQWSACDKGSCTEEPDEVESLTSGSEPGVKEGIPLPTVTNPSRPTNRGPYCCWSWFCVVSMIAGSVVSPVGGSAPAVGRPKGEQDEEMASTFDSLGVVRNSSHSSCSIPPTINYSSKLKSFLRAAWGGHDWHRAIQSAIESLGGLA